MLEHAVVPSSRRSRFRAITLPVSIALHLVVVAAVVVASVWNVGTPDDPPRQVSTYSVGVSPAVPLPPPPPPIRRGRAEQPAPETPVSPPTDVAPSEIPDTDPAQAADADTDVIGVPDGDPDGDPEGDVDGTPGGVRDSVGREPAGGGEPSRTYRMGEGVTAPSVLSRVDPKYPELARKIGEEGTVVLECTIDRYGAVRNARVVRGAHPLLDQAALDAVRQWRFRPARFDGRAVDVIFHLTVNFDLGR